MAKIEFGIGFNQNEAKESPQEDTVEAQTERAFGLTGEDTAMSMDEYNRQQEE